MAGSAAVTVRELIHELQQCPGDAPVRVANFYGWQSYGNTAPVEEVIVGRHSNGSVTIYLGPLPIPKVQP